MDNNNIIPIVWQISVSHLDNRTLFRGVLLKGEPFMYDERTGNFKNLLKVSKSYFIGVYGNKEISITTNDKTISTNTDKHGSFLVVANFLQKGELTINTDASDKPLKILQTYPVIFQNTKSPFDVISDIDDTIIVSYTTDFFKRVGTLAFVAPQQRKTIDFTKKLFEEFKKHDIRVFYVSKSESNLFGMLTSFIEHNNLPKGNIILTPYLKFSQLLNPKKGRDYKLNNIRFLIENSGNKTFVLIGDDSQRDMEIYSEIAVEFPKKILKIYIRQTRSKFLSYHKRMWEKLQLTGVPVISFNDDTNMNVQTEIELLNNAAL